MFLAEALNREEEVVSESGRQEDWSRWNQSKAGWGQGNRDSGEDQGGEETVEGELCHHDQAEGWREDRPTLGLLESEGQTRHPTQIYNTSRRKEISEEEEGNEGQEERDIEEALDGQEGV